MPKATQQHIHGRAKIHSKDLADLQLGRLVPGHQLSTALLTNSQLKGDRKRRVSKGTDLGVTHINLLKAFSHFRAPNELISGEN